VILKVQPPPGVFCSERLPPIASIAHFAIARPRPVPGSESARRRDRSDEDVFARRGDLGPNR
jgi:hypothetical protein